MGSNPILGLASSPVGTVTASTSPAGQDDSVSGWRSAPC